VYGSLTISNIAEFEVKELWKSVSNRQYYGKDTVAHFFLKVDYMAQIFQNHPTPICTWRDYVIGTPNLLQELTAESVYTSQ